MSHPFSFLKQTKVIQQYLEVVLEAFLNGVFCWTHLTITLSICRQGLFLNNLIICDWHNNLPFLAYIFPASSSFFLGIKSWHLRDIKEPPPLDSTNKPQISLQSSMHWPWSNFDTIDTQGYCNGSNNAVIPSTTQSTTGLVEQPAHSTYDVPPALTVIDVRQVSWLTHSCRPYSILTRISDQTCEKIWNNKFIDFGILISNPVKQDCFKLSIETDNPTDTPALSLVPSEKAVAIYNINRWLTVFHIFVGVYTNFPGGITLNEILLNHLWFGS